MDISIRDARIAAALDLMRQFPSSQDDQILQLAAQTSDGRPVSDRDLSVFERPFPALTPSERLHLDVYGYVVIEGVLTSDEVEELRDTITAVERRAQSGENLDDLAPAFFLSRTSEFFRVDNLPHIAPCFFDYLTHPRIVGMAEETMGGPVRLEQSDAHIHRPRSAEHQKYGFHRGFYGWAPTIAGGLFHYPFVKALTNLTDLGPDDGGTAVIAGSHKLSNDADVNAVIAAAMADPRLIHHVEAPAGSTLLFYEALIHSSGIIRSGKDRMLVLGGYTPTMFAACRGYEPSMDLLARLPEQYRVFFTGGLNYFCGALTPRRLSDPVQPSSSG